MQSRLQRYCTLRLFIVFLVVAIGYGTQWATSGDPEVSSFLLLALAAVAVGTWASWYVTRREVAGWFLPAQLAWDVFFSSVLCYLTGATYSLGQLVFLVAIAGAAWVGRPGAAMGAAALSAVGFLLAVALTPREPGPIREDDIVRYTEAMFRVFGFFLMAGVTDYLFRSLRQEQATTAYLGAQHESVLERVRAAVVTADATGRVSDANPAARALFGDIEGRLLVELFPGHAYTDNTTWEERTATGRSLVCSTGELPDGATVIVAEDITELTRTREERDRAERLEGVARVAAGLAHEIRNPLSSISGCLQLIREERPSRPADLALGEADRLNRLVEDFLVMSRAPHIEPDPVDVHALAAEVADAFARDQRYQDRVQVRREGTVALALIDADRIRQTLWNLLLNAAQAMPDGGTVTMATRPATRGPAGGALGVEIVVTDEGVGIPPELRGRIFDPTFTRRAGGTGLGLAMVDQVVRAHRGEVSVQAPAAGGTEFRIWLPNGEDDAG